MTHVTCDCCGKELRPGEDFRYVIKIEAYAAHDPAEITDADLEDDHLEAIGEILRAMEDHPHDEIPLAAPTRNFRYDLCSHCHQKFVRDPLGRGQLEKVDFSKN
jgi:hypothetical protein